MTHRKEPVDEGLFGDPTAVERSARISDDGLYRYELERVWNHEKWLRRLLTFVMLNPSTADADDDDRTIGRCCGFGRDLGYDGIRVVNLDAYIATKPTVLRRALAAGVDVVGPDNGRTLAVAMLKAYNTRSQVICAWGAGARPDRVGAFLDLTARVSGWSSHDNMGNPHCGRSLDLSALHITKSGAPGHPLYLPADAVPVPWPVPS